MRITDYNKKYQNSLEQLNPAQKIAVNEIDGPVLVVAGPGTGKTHILAARIGKILTDTDTQPHNILCLTYTDAGVVAMRQRLIQLIGPTGHRVHIFTFHSFANNIIQDHIEYFGLNNMQPVSDLEQIQIVHSMLDELPANHTLIKGKFNRYYRTPHLIDIFNKMKTEHWSVDEISKKIDEYLESLLSRKEFIYQRNSKLNTKGSLNQKKILAEKRKMNLLKDAVALFPIYQKKLKKSHRYEFADMILWVLDAFKNYPFLLEKYQEQYLYFLVDEYQDTNAAQSDLLQVLIDYWDNPNVFIVGDDDQSIYEFQGAKLKNIIHFLEKYHDSTKLVVLTDNYRSSQNILDTASRSIQNNQLRLVNKLDGLDKKLIAQSPLYAKSTIQPVLRIYENNYEEDIHIVSEIEKLYKKGIPLKDVAIIFSRHKQVEIIKQLLQKKGIPFQSKKPANVLENIIIQQLRTLMTYVDGEFQKPYTHDYLLYKIMHFSFFNISTRDIALISLHLRKIPLKNRPKWRDVLACKSLLLEIKVSEIDKILAFSNTMESFIQDVINFPLPILLERMINQSGLITHILQHNDKSLLLKILHSFIDFIQAESLRKPKTQLKDILAIFDTIDNEYKLSIPLKKSFSNPNGVNIVTAHSAKGLEFEYVFMKGIIDKSWEKSTSNKNSFKLPDTITFTQEESKEESMRRLFFVGITRAKEKLFISYAKRNEKDKDQSKSQFIDEIIDTLDIQEISLDPQKVIEDTALLIISQDVNLHPAVLKTEINEILENFQLNISALNTYLRCPLSFYYNHILNIPSGNSITAHYGHAIHHALNHFFRNMLKSKEKEFPNKNILIELFEKEMRLKMAFFSKTEFNFYFETGQHILGEYYDAFIHEFPKNIEIEYHIGNTTYKGIPIVGDLDRIDYINDFHVSIVDYKTGKILKKHINPPNEKQEYGGKYWRQLVFYKILYEHSTRSKHKVKSGKIAYLSHDEQDKFQTYELNISQDNEHFLGNLIESTWSKIQNHDFYKGCSKPNCVWCQFVENDVVPNSFADLDAESLDD